MTNEVEQPKELPKQLVLADMSIEALKALVYDQSKEMIRIQTNINAIEAELAKRGENAKSGQ